MNRARPFLMLIATALGFIPAPAAGSCSAPSADVNGDGGIDVSDAVSLLAWLFNDGPAPVAAVCPAGAPDRENGEVNDDGKIDISDPIYILAWLFGGGAAPMAIRCTAEMSECEALLCSLGIDWVRGPEHPGVAAPVTVRLPLGGIRFRAVGAELPRETLFMDCSLAVALYRAAALLSRRGVVEVADYGIYNYRCIGGGTPPDCPNGLSMHALAQAVDVAALITAGGDQHSVLEDWVIDPPAEQTCAAPAASESDAFLHQAACELYESEVFNIILTPNYNADHRNHFHLDLTAGAKFIR